MTKPSTTSISEKKFPTLYLGLPIWQHPSWPTQWFADSKSRLKQLSHYANYFNSIEGNTTFYSIPTTETVQRWYDSVPDNFRFTFKLHQSLSHQACLRNIESLLEEQLGLLQGLGEKLGVVMLQLPASFDPEQMNLLQAFIQRCAQKCCLAVEVRHPAFFQKQNAEIQFNRLLIEHQVNRIMMDTRALNTGPATSEILAETRRKKPKLPTNVIATARNPVVRFVGNDNDNDNAQGLMPWVHKIHQWRQQGKTPYLFLHRPDNKHAPWLAAQFIDMYNTVYPQTPLRSMSFPSKAQHDLF